MVTYLEKNMDHAPKHYKIYKNVPKQISTCESTKRSLTYPMHVLKNKYSDCFAELNCHLNF